MTAMCPNSHLIMATTSHQESTIPDANARKNNPPHTYRTVSQVPIPLQVQRTSITGALLGLWIDHEAMLSHQTHRSHRRSILVFERFLVRANSTCTRVATASLPPLMARMSILRGVLPKQTSQGNVWLWHVWTAARRRSNVSLVLAAVCNARRPNDLVESMYAVSIRQSFANNSQGLQPTSPSPSQVRRPSGKAVLDPLYVARVCRIPTKYTLANWISTPTASDERSMMPRPLADLRRSIDRHRQYTP